MNETKPHLSNFRSQMAHRLLLAAGLVGVASACGDQDTATSGQDTSTTTTTSGGGAGAGRAETASVSGSGPGGAGPSGSGAGIYGGTTEWTECYSLAELQQGGAGGTSAGGASAGGASAGGASAGGLGGSQGLGGAQGGAAPVPTCPSYPEVVGCGEVTEQLGYSNGECCYRIEGDCVGRPYVVDGQVRTAEPVYGRGSSWGQWSGVLPATDHLSRRVRSALAEAWMSDGLYEHASVASFNRFSMELLAVGAPAELVGECQQAALDEVQHARACFALSSAYASESVRPGRFPFDASVRVSSDLADVAARAVAEGCVGETLAALQAAEQHAAATDPAVARVLDMIAHDEARHAELAWKTVAWALANGSAPVRHAVAEAFERAIEGQLMDADLRSDAGSDDGQLARHGRLPAATVAELKRRTILDVIAPCAQRLLARHGQPLSVRAPAQA